MNKVRLLLGLAITSIVIICGCAKFSENNPWDFNFGKQANQSMTVTRHNPGQAEQIVNIRNM